MPWMNVNAIREQDGRAIYRFIDSLGPKGKPMPGNVSSGEEPKTPYYMREPQKPGG